MNEIFLWGRSPEKTNENPKLTNKQKQIKSMLSHYPDFYIIFRGKAYIYKKNKHNLEDGKDGPLTEAFYSYLVMLKNRVEN